MSKHLRKFPQNSQQLCEFMAETVTLYIGLGSSLRWSMYFGNREIDLVLVFKDRQRA